MTAPSGAPNVVLDCPSEYALPTRETAIAVDPTNPKHLVEAAIDRPFGDQTIEFATSFDAGRTWTIGDIPHGVDLQNFDPWVAFDVKHGEVIVAFQGLGANANYCPPAGGQMVATSSDGGVHWQDPITVSENVGCPGTADSYFFGEAKISVDDNASSPHYGRTWMTGNFELCTGGVCSYPAGEAHSDDGGATWTTPQAISGSNPDFCTAGDSAPACDNDFSPVHSAIAPDGSVTVMFVNEQHEAAWEPGECCEDQLLSVRTTDGGLTWSPPVHVVDLEDGIDNSLGDYHCSLMLNFTCALNRTDLLPIYVDSNLAYGLDGTLYVAFSDNRNGRHDKPHPVSNNDVFLMSSEDGGQTWHGPDVVSDAPGDQYKPSLAVNPVTGELGILFYDRSADPHGTNMDVTLATGLPGSFDLERIDTAPSHLSDDLWFTQTLPGCFRCVFHIGEYVGLAIGSDGGTNMSWADLRHYTTTPEGHQGYAMNVEYAREEMDWSR